MLNPKTLRGRLGLGYACALVAALVAFAAIALAVVDRAQRSDLDVRLQATAGALTVIGDVHHDRLVVDAKDREQFHTIVGAKAQSAILDRDGMVLVTTNDRMAQALASLAIVRERIASFGDAVVANERVRVFAIPIRDHGTLVGSTLAWSDTDAIGRLDRNVLAAFAIAIPSIACLAIVAGGEIARRGLVPLERIASVASEIEARDLSRRLGLPARGDELGVLGATFDRMLDRLQSAFDRERRFTSDASHELRAPLSVIRAEADLALRTQRTPEEYRRALETIAAEADELEALTRDLLAAARGSGPDSEDVRSAVDLSDVAETVAQRMTPIAATRSVNVHREPGGAIVRANRTLLERAIVSVLHNALKYAPEAGSVEIRVARNPSDVELTISDDGPGFSETALHRGFDRFWRDDDARGREGSGLGLALAKTIVERYGGTIALANARPHGAIVRMTFPETNVR